MTPDQTNAHGSAKRVADGFLLLSCATCTDLQREHATFTILQCAALLWPHVKALAEANPEISARAKSEVAQIQAIQRMANVDPITQSPQRSAA